MMEKNVNTSIDRLQSARRKLFPDENDNDSENQNFYNRIREENLQRSKEKMEKWNFDFKREMPLPGRYIWVKVDEHGNEISDSANLENEEQNKKEQEEQTNETEKESRKRNDEPMKEIVTKRTKLEKS